MPSLRPSRRDFLRASLAAGVTLPVWRASQSLAQPGQTASMLVAGKSDRLEVLKATPHVLQTPVDALQSRITAPDMLFVRNNQDLAGASTLEPFEGDAWMVEFSGQVSRPGSIDLATLRSLPQTSVEMVLQCSGNGRSKFSEIAQTEGTQWGRGAIGNVTFEGVRLKDALSHFGISPDDAATFLRAEGQDSPKPGEEDFEHSMPLNDAYEDALLALKLNGEDLPRIHGGPVRLVLPGYYATVNIKWLTHLHFESEESRNPNHAARYRTPLRPIEPGSMFDFTLRNSTPTWRMKTASLITSHESGQKVAAGKQRLSGWTWNDGLAAITGVFLSDNYGESWRRISLQPAASPYAWRAFQTELDLKPGMAEFWIAAVDALGRSQPVSGDPGWNPRGYEWNAIERIALNVQ